MIARKVASRVVQEKRKNLCLLLLGPRGSGKTSLAKECCAEYVYYDLRCNTIRAQVLKNPYQFFVSLCKPSIFDNFQCVIEISGHILKILKTPSSQQKPFVLISSTNLPQLSSVASAILVYPFTYSEKKNNGLEKSCEDIKLEGEGARPVVIGTKQDVIWNKQYIRSLVHKCVGSDHGEDFLFFLKICAGRTTLTLDFSAFEDRCAVGRNTIKRWFQVLKDHFIIFSLPSTCADVPTHYQKQERIYFYDLSLLCYLLQIHSNREVFDHNMRDVLFKNWVVSELYKENANHKNSIGMLHYTDSSKRNADLVLIAPLHKSLILMNIKNQMTYHSKIDKKMTEIRSLFTKRTLSTYVVYLGDYTGKVKDLHLLSWKKLGDFVEDLSMEP